jgi:hypothetical protein
MIVHIAKNEITNEHTISVLLKFLFNIIFTSAGVKKKDGGGECIVKGVCSAMFR